MSISQLKVLKKDRRYNRPLAFNPTGQDIKILLDAIEESQPNELLDPIKYSKGYNGSMGMTLSGIEVKAIVDSIACPPDNLWIIRNKLRYNTRHEYILTGKDIKILVDAIEDTSCLTPPDPVYNLYYSVFSDGRNSSQPDVTVDVGGLGGLMDSCESISAFMNAAYPIGGGWWGDNAGEFFMWCASEAEPTMTMQLASNGTPIPLTWVEITPFPDDMCFTFTGTIENTNAGWFYSIQLDLPDPSFLRMDNTANPFISDTVNCQANLLSTLQYAFGPQVLLTLTDVDGSNFIGQVSKLPFEITAFNVTEDGATIAESALTTPCI